jgi:hypothetical protein
MAYRALTNHNGGRLTDVERRVYFLAFSQTWCVARTYTHAH